MIQPKTRRPSNGKHKAPPETLPPMPPKPANNERDEE